MRPLPSAALAREKLYLKVKVCVPSQGIWEASPVLNFAADDTEILNSLLSLCAISPNFIRLGRARELLGDRLDAGCLALVAPGVLTRAPAEARAAGSKFRETGGGMGLGYWGSGP
jgi:hypothetical protein